MFKKSLLFFICLLNIATIFGQEYERYNKLMDTTITSKYLGFDKHITITVPFEWQTEVDRNFPLVVVFDRQNPRSHQYILNTIDYLTSNEQMPSAVIISIESEQKYRYHETLHQASNDKGLALENEQFLFNELIPFAEAELKASSFRLFIGHSRYGYFTTSLFHKRTNDLNGVIALSPFYLQKHVDLRDSIAKLDDEKFESKKYYRFGIGNDYPEQFAKMESIINQMNNAKIDAKGVLFPEANHNVTPGLIIAPALYDIFEEWSTIQAKYFDNAQKDLTTLQALEEEVVLHYGNELAFALGILNGKGWYFYGEGEFEKAIEAWEIMMKSYPNFAEGYLYILEAQQQLKMDYSVTEDKFNTCLALTKIYTKEEKGELKAELKELKGLTELKQTKE